MASPIQHLVSSAGSTLAPNSPAAAQARAHTAASLNPAQAIQAGQAHNAKSIKGDDKKRAPLVQKKVESSFSSGPNRAKPAPKAAPEEEEKEAASNPQGSEGQTKIDVLA